MAAEIASPAGCRTGRTSGFNEAAANGRGNLSPAYRGIAGRLKLQ